MTHIKENLLLQFSVVSLLVMLVLAGVLYVVIARGIQAAALDNLVDDAINHATVQVLKELSPQDLQQPMTGDRYQRFHEFVQQFVVSSRTARVKVWANDGTVVYSSDPASVGKRYRTEGALLKALAGQTTAVAKPTSELEDESERALGPLMEVYTPIIFPGTTGPQGALEIYQFYGPTARVISDLRRQLMLAFGLGFAFLYLTLVGFSWAGWKTIVRHRTNLATAVANLQESEARSRTIVDTAADGIVTTNERGIIQSFNPAASRIFGYAPAEAIGRNLSILMPEPYSSQHDRCVEDYLRSGQAAAHNIGHTCTGMRKDGTAFPLEMSVSEVRLAKGRVFTGIVRDITERKQAEETLRESETLYRAVVENVTDGISITVGTDRVFANKAYLGIYGLREMSEVIGQPLGALVHPEDREALVQRNLARQRGEVVPQVNEYRVCWPSGEVRTVQSSVVLINYQGKPATLAVVRDITERKQSEEALRQSNRDLQEALAKLKAAQSQLVRQERLHALGQMASGIAHDFNNTLTPILGFTELLLAPGALDNREKAARYLSLVNSAAKDAAIVVHRLREFYRPRGAGEPLEPVDLNKVVEKTISLTEPRWKNQALASGAAIRIETQLGAVPLVEGNEAELTEALTNLVFNAVDALIPPDGNGGTAKEGVIRIRTRALGDQVALEVSDTGIGMTEETRHRCMEPFFTTKGGHGTGLGLAVVLGMMQRCDGTIDIESAVGKGTTVVLRFPLRSPRKAGPTKQEPDSTVRPLHVLVVDDEAGVRQVVVAYLAAEGHTAEEAANGREALEKFRTGQFDLVVTDLGMPQMTGDHLAAAIKQLASDMPVVLLTGFGNVLPANTEETTSVDVVVNKPVTREQLRQAIAKVVNK